MYVCVREHLFILVGCDSDELRLLKGDVGDQAVLGAHTYDVKLRLILVQGVEHDLSADETRHVTHTDIHQHTRPETCGHTYVHSNTHLRTSGHVHSHV